ncbi:thiolase family protein [Sinomonas gamaensis]|uniref:thiolase family protein n=1 Tax=Sinomonas gamaensis TaxID=2565624 RepID=UPI001108832F|nr:thiolase family protein [Sinomonas gamaensis]
MTEAFVYDAVRTPFGKFGGGLAGVRPDDLAAHIVRAIVDRAPGLTAEALEGTDGKHSALDEVIFGNANGAGEENRNVARMATLLAGLPTSIPGTTVNRLCGSSLDGAMIASRQIAVGDADVVLVGGVESMSRAPWVLPKTEKPYPAGDLQLSSTTLGWRLVNPNMPSEWTVSLGEATEQLRERHAIGRDRQDEFAARSHNLSDKAWNEGFYDDLVVPMPGTDLSRDEGIRPGSSAEKLAGLRTSFRPDNGDRSGSTKGGTVTAGNASPLSDGASAVLLGSEAAAGTLGLEPIARIAGRGAAANEPQFFGFAPVEAANRALEKAGIGWDQVGAVELNEAFAAQSLACLDAWKIDPEIVNQHGGAIAMGHPLGASGGRILGTLARSLQRSGERWGVAAICIGVGQGLAVVLENVAASKQSAK